MWSCWEAVICVIVTFATWMQPMTGHLKGWLIVYGSQQSIEANATYRGYDLALSPSRCGVAAMSPANLGATVWVRPESTEGDREWPWEHCIVIDTAARNDWHHLVYEVPGGDLLEIPRWLAQRWGTDYGLRGEAYFGDCPPPDESIPLRYMPPYVEDHRRPVVAYSAWPYPEQESVVSCNRHPTPAGHMESE